MNKKEKGNDQRPSGNEEEYTGSQGRLQTVALEKKSKGGTRRRR
jgi:hypothetical protein